MKRLKLSYLNFILTFIALGLTILILQNVSIMYSFKEAKTMFTINKKGKIVVPVDVYGDVDVNIESCSTTVPVEGTVEVDR